MDPRAERDVWAHTEITGCFEVAARPANTRAPSLRHGTGEGRGMLGSRLCLPCATRSTRVGCPALWVSTPCLLPPSLPSSTAPLPALLPPWGAQPGSTPSPAPEGPRRSPRRKSRVDRDRWEHAKKAESPYSGKWVAEWEGASSRSTHPGALRYRAGVRVFPLFSFLWPVSTSSAF